MIIRPVFGSSKGLPDLQPIVSDQKLKFFWRVISEEHEHPMARGLTEKIVNVKDVDDLIELFFNAIKISYPQKRQRELREIFNALLEQGQVNQALELVEQVLDPLEQSFLLKRISEVLLEKREIERAFEVAKSIPDPLQKSLAIHHICFVLAMEGHTELAFEMAKAMPDHLTQSYTIKIISEVLLEEGKPDEALHVIYFMPEGQEKDYALENVIQVFTRSGGVDEALDLLEKIQDDFIRSKAIMIILKALLKVGKVDEAIKLTEKMPHDLVQLRAFKKIQRDLLRQGELQKAGELILKISFCKKKLKSESLPHVALLACPSIPENPFSLNESPLADEVKILEDFLFQIIEKLSLEPFSKRYLKQKNNFEAICHKMYSIAEHESEPVQKKEYEDLEHQVRNQLSTMAPATLEILRRDFAQDPEICLNFFDSVILVLKTNRIMYSNQLLPPIESLLPQILSYNTQQLAFLCEKFIEEKNLKLALSIALKISDLDVQSSLLQRISSPLLWKRNPFQAIEIAELIPHAPMRKLALQLIDSFMIAKGGKIYTDS